MLPEQLPIETTPATVAEPPNGHGSQDHGRNRGGAPRGNTNGFRHGLRSASLPADCKYVEFAANHFREQLEAATVQAHGEIDVTRAAYISSAIRHEKAASLLERWLRVEKGLTLQDRVQVLAGISRATDSRDKCLEKLNLTRTEKETLLTDLYSPRALPPTEPPALQPPDASTTRCDTTDGESSSPPTENAAESEFESVGGNPDA